MPNIVITETAVYVKVDFNDLAATVGVKTGYYNHSDIITAELSDDEAYVKVYTLDGQVWLMDMNGTNGLPVDTVKGVTPTDNADLAAKIAEPMT